VYKPIVTVIIKGLSGSREKLSKDCGKLT